METQIFIAQRRIFHIASLVLLYILDSYGQVPCIDLKDHVYKVKTFKQGVDEYTLSISKDSFIKTLKDGTIVNGKIQRQGCLLSMQESQADATSFDNEVENGLGFPAIQVIEIEGSRIYFKIVRSRNINVILEEGQMQISKTIAGRVIDAFDFRPMPEVNLKLGATVLATTDTNGNFTAQLPQDADTLLVTFIGMEPMYVRLSDTCTRVEVIMIPDGTYDYMSIGKINRKRKRYFDELPAKHKIAFERGVFTSASPCLSYLFQKQR